MTERRPPLQTLRVGVKTLSIVGKGITDVYLAFRFETKLTILLATSGVARVKNLD